MSNFQCEKCGTICYDTPNGYITGCEHYPADLKHIDVPKYKGREFGKHLDEASKIVESWPVWKQHVLKFWKSGGFEEGSNQ